MKEYKEKFLPSNTGQDNIGVFTNKGNCCVCVEYACNIYGVYLNKKEVDKLINILKEAKKVMKKYQE